MIGILGAMEIEVDGLLSCMTGVVRESAAGREIFSGMLSGRDVAVMLCGIGKVNAAISAQTMILQKKPELIINTGVGGSLDESLSILDIAIGSGVVQYDIDNTPLGYEQGFTCGVESVVIPLDEGAGQGLLRAVKSQGFTGKICRIASGDRFLTDGAEKDRLRQAFSVSVCDEESAGVAQACALAGVRCAVLRSVSDSTDGAHAMEYAEFARRAADNATTALLRFLRDEV